MTRFTDTPSKKYFPDPPRRAVWDPPPPALPPTHPCHGCPYRRDAPCLGVCYRDLLRRK